VIGAVEDVREWIRWLQQGPQPHTLAVKSLSGQLEKRKGDLRMLPERSGRRRLKQLT
jgi:hypothetical protein